MISTDGGSSSLQGTLDGSGFICNRESLDVNSAAVGDGVGSGTRDNDLIGFLGQIGISCAELQRISSDIAVNGISGGFDDEVAGGSGVVGVEVNFRGICEDQVTGIGDRDLLANGQILITHEHTALTGNCHRAGIGDRTLVELNGLFSRYIERNVSGIVEIVSKTRVGDTGFSLVTDRVRSNAECEILAGDRSDTGLLVGSGAGAFDGTGLKRAFLDREIIRVGADRHVALRAVRCSVVDVEVQVELGEGSCNRCVGGAVYGTRFCNAVEGNRTVGLLGIGIFGNLPVKGRTVDDQFAAAERIGTSAGNRIFLRHRTGRANTGRAVSLRTDNTRRCVAVSIHCQRSTRADFSGIILHASSRSHASAERERSDSGGDNGLCTLSLDARCGFVNHHQRTTCFREDHLEITIHSFTPRIMRFFLHQRLRAINRTSARSTDGSVGMDVSTSCVGGGKPYVDFLKTV